MLPICSEPAALPVWAAANAAADRDRSARNVADTAAVPGRSAANAAGGGGTARGGGPGPLGAERGGGRRHVRVGELGQADVLPALARVRPPKAVPAHQRRHQ